MVSPWFSLDEAAHACGGFLSWQPWGLPVSQCQPPLLSCLHGGVACQRGPLAHVPLSHLSAGEPVPPPNTRRSPRTVPKWHTFHAIGRPAHESHRDSRQENSAAQGRTEAHSQIRSNTELGPSVHARRVRGAGRPVCARYIRDDTRSSLVARDATRGYATPRAALARHPAHRTGDERLSTGLPRPPSTQAQHPSLPVRFCAPRTSWR